MGGGLSRPAGQCLIGAVPVKGARKLASLRDGASATLDCHPRLTSTRRLSGKGLSPAPGRPPPRIEKYNSLTRNQRGHQFIIRASYRRNRSSRQ
jgi:hypothetical protein